MKNKIELLDRCIVSNSDLSRVESVFKAALLDTALRL